MDLGPGITIVSVPEQDRAEFIRDAEAALRVGNPRAGRAFLMRLCRRRASIELHEEFRQKSITRADIEALHAARTAQLYSLCERLGYFQTRVTEIQIGGAPIWKI